ncbi:MAG: hypothetical protein SFV15_23500 [Polyangiaceae bacterium]|nr:hypothetical protein [Polyangiaceae bacterium]
MKILPILSFGAISLLSAVASAANGCTYGVFVKGVSIGDYLQTGSTQIASVSVVNASGVKQTTDVCGAAGGGFNLFSTEPGYDLWVPILLAAYVSSSKVTICTSSTPQQACTISSVTFQR